jgi:hypothetical protein
MNTVFIIATMVHYNRLIPNITRMKLMRKVVGKNIRRNTAQTE